MVPSVDGQTVTVVVRTLVSGGSAGTGGSRSTTVQVTPPCRYVPGMTGKDYYVLAFLRSSGPGATEVTAEATWSLT